MEVVAMTDRIRSLANALGVTAVQRVRDPRILAPAYLVAHRRTSAMIGLGLPTCLGTRLHARALQGSRARERRS